MHINKYSGAPYPSCMQIMNRFTFRRGKVVPENHSQKRKAGFEVRLGVRRF